MLLVIVEIIFPESIILIKRNSLLKTRNGNVFFFLIDFTYIIATALGARLRFENAVIYLKTKSLVL